MNTIYLYLGLAALIGCLSYLSYYEIEKNGELGEQLKAKTATINQVTKDLSDLNLRMTLHQSNVRKDAIEAHTRASSPDSSVEQMERLIEEKSQ